jgi:hypothetical protein
MLFGFDLNHLFLFPVENTQARQRFLVGTLLLLAAIFIPIVPYLLITGYMLRIMRQVIAGQSASMPAWDDWETMFKDGLKLFGVRIVYFLPMLLILLPFMAVFFFAPFLAEASRDGEAIFAMLMFSFSIMFMCLMPFFFALAAIIPAAEAHFAATGEFKAGFRINEWWPIFTKNFGGFIVAFMIFYGVTMIASIGLQILMFTVILLCFLPILAPMFSFYMLIIQYTTVAQAYREGVLKLQAAQLPADQPEAQTQA